MSTTPAPPTNTPQTPSPRTKLVSSNAPRQPCDTFGAVYAFNNAVARLYTGKGKDQILVDTSGSISGENELLERAALAALVQGTSAEGAFEVPEPAGASAIVGAVSECLKNAPDDAIVYLLSDGAENCHNGPLSVGKTPDGSDRVIDVDFTDNKGHANELADHLQHLGVKFCVLGLGAEAKPMVTQMLNRRNVFCGHVDGNADVKTIVSVVRTLKRVATGKAGESVTRNGTQHTLLVALDPDVQKSIQNLTPAEMTAVDKVIGRVRIKNGSIVCPSDLRRALGQVFEEYDEDITGHEDDIKAALLLAMESMCGAVLPGALITSKHASVIGVPRGWRSFRRHCNRLLSKLAKSGILKREQVVAEGGVEVEHNGQKHRFAAGCAQYSCSLPKAAVCGLARDDTFCTARDKLPGRRVKKRKQKSGPVGRKKMRAN